MKIDLTILQKNELFSGMEQKDIESMLSCLGYNVRKYPKGDIVWHVGSRIGGFGVVLRGQVQVIREDYFGKRSIIATIHPGGVFGEAFACAGLMESPLAVSTGEASEILFLQVEKILTTCKNACVFHSELIRRLVRMLAVKNLTLNKKMDFLSRRSTREKLSAYLLSEYSEKKANPFLIDLNRNELADYLSVDRSAMSRELSHMRDEGILDYWKNSFKILDFYGLES
ncbi:MAG: Crp/Fnr family transcriptional regulator [Christensenella sp.]|uniref:Crp/Fnr family transcriptional regulator n=1 Tax=Christensenella sp. TaxID=1935934 RepID=UPI002B2164E6|nr:Crp/Fnr family transcriptional regulator [Christensenella sp.]MEA5004023.1 Crp/Fnr family transcriptional regulator [Christensenella sp.]